MCSLKKHTSTEIYFELMFSKNFYEIFREQSKQLQTICLYWTLLKAKPPERVRAGARILKSLSHDDSFERAQTLDI